MSIIKYQEKNQLNYYSQSLPAVISKEVDRCCSVPFVYPLAPRWRYLSYHSGRQANSAMNLARNCTEENPEERETDNINVQCIA